MPTWADRPWLILWRNMTAIFWAGQASYPYGRPSNDCLSQPCHQHGQPHIPRCARCRFGRAARRGPAPCQAPLTPAQLLCEKGWRFSGRARQPPWLLSCEATHLWRRLPSMAVRLSIVILAALCALGVRGSADFDGPAPTRPVAVVAAAAIPASHAPVVIPAHLTTVNPVIWGKPCV